MVTEILGEDAVTSVRLRNLVTGVESEMAVSGVFIFIGQEPCTDFLRGTLKLDETGRVVVNEWTETDLPGVFAAGDMRANAARQAVSAAGDGATAAIRADQYISANFGDQAGLPTPCHPGRCNIQDDPQGSGWVPVGLAVFKTVVGRPASSQVGSTPTHSRQFSNLKIGRLRSILAGRAPSKCLAGLAFANHLQMGTHGTGF